MPNSKLFTAILVATIYLYSASTLFGQDIAQLAMGARNNLYNHWNFDSVAYYFDQVIGEKYAPAFAYSDYGWYLMLLNKFEEGLTYIQKAAEMDPRDKQLVTWNSWALLWSGDLAKAKQWCGRALAIDPDYGEALQVGSRIACEMNNHQEAIRLAEKAAAKDPAWRALIPFALAKAGNREKAMLLAEKITKDANVNDVWLLMEIYAHLGNDDKALHYLEKSYELRYPFIPWLKFEQSIKHLHDDSRFKTIVHSMNLPK